MSRSPAPAAARWSGYVAVAIVFAIACAFLSNWQFARNDERAAQLELVERNYDADPVTLDQAIPADGAFDAGDEWLPVRLVGRYLSDDELLVRNRPHGGTAAFEVLVPFQLEDGRILIVDRGWVPPGQNQRDPDAVPAPPEGSVEAIVRLRPGEPLTSSGQSVDGGQIPTINLPLIADIVGGDVIEDAYGALAAENPAPQTAPGALADPSEDPGPHLSYAIQWILFAVMGFVFIGYMIRTEIRARREEAAETDEVASDAAATGPTSRRRRKDRDADDEDALVDALTR